MKNSAANGGPGEEPRSKPSALERGRMRRRLRRQQRVREALLLDLGALVFELHRSGRREPELLQAKAAELTAVDQEVRTLAEALEADLTTGVSVDQPAGEVPSGVPAAGDGVPQEDVQEVGSDETAVMGALYGDMGKKRADWGAPPWAAEEADEPHAVESVGKATPIRGGKPKPGEAEGGDVVADTQRRMRDARRRAKKWLDRGGGDTG